MMGFGVAGAVVGSGEGGRGGGGCRDGGLEAIDRLV